MNVLKKKGKRPRKNSEMKWKGMLKESQKKKCKYIVYTNVCLHEKARVLFMSLRQVAVRDFYFVSLGSLSAKSCVGPVL